ncbi:Zn(2)-C6 fungal-type domain-containing protein [Mycena chlorophos]|uniref:Zn(2)-C6 fungal-type domain-containing protein n=1 Tax=Mycena chlorophos TaxID=658473 RepID=A0A8H6VW62_MYCCL|nr:Zn(2)-C6 fungal-type domain-containing protein [Mycena chlorophos]
MSSDDEVDLNTPPTKKRRVQRACDWCRRKKRACDGLKMAENKCSNCIENGLECTFAGAETKRRSYVDVLEARLELTESLLRKLGNPNAAPIAAWSTDSPITSHKSTSIPAPPPPGPGVELAALTIRSMNTPAPAPHEDDLAHIALVKDLQDLSVSHHRSRFHGKSSGAMLVKAAVLAREGYEEKVMPWASRRMHYWTYNPAKDKIPHVGPFVYPPTDLLRSLIDLYFLHQNTYYPLLHRPTFLNLVFTDNLHETDASFGAIVLLVCAIGARFSDDPRVCPPGAEPLRVGWEFFDQLPLIIDHLFVRPTLYHLQFYCLATAFLEFSTPASCWTLIGIGIRLAQDVGAHRLQNFGPGAGAKPTIEGELWKRAFWVLVCMDRQVSTSLGRPCTTQYEDFDAELPIEVDDEFWGTEEKDIAVGVSTAPGEPPMGKKHPLDLPPGMPTPLNTPTPESSGSASGSGSSPGKSSTSTSTSPAASSGDKSSPDSGTGTGADKTTAGTGAGAGAKPPPFTQPPGRPSTVTFFNCMIRLNNILGFSLQLLYGLSKAKALLAHRDDAWEEHIVAELDSALNGWVDSIPAHLRWDPNRPRTPQDDLFFDQSALLYCSYYTVQMTIHRPFIPVVRNGGNGAEAGGPGPGKPTSLPSLAICTNAARSASHVIETSRLRKNGTPVPVLMTPAFTAGLVLLLNVWSGKRTGLPPHMNSAIFEVHKCMRSIRVCEGRWQSAGLFWDLLYELASIGQLPLPIPQTPMGMGMDFNSAMPRDMYTTGDGVVRPMPPGFDARTGQREGDADDDVAEMYLSPAAIQGAAKTTTTVQPQHTQMHVMGPGALAASIPEQGALFPPTVYIPLAAQSGRPSSTNSGQFAAPLPRPMDANVGTTNASSSAGQPRPMLPQTPVYGFGRTLPTYTSDLGRLPVFHQQQQAQRAPQQRPPHNPYGMYGGFDGVVSASGAAANLGSGYAPDGGYYAAPTGPIQQQQTPLEEASIFATPQTSASVPSTPTAASGTTGAMSMTSTSSWYPAQTSAAPFGFPDFAAGGRSGAAVTSPVAPASSMGPTGTATAPDATAGLSDSDIFALFGPDALAFVEGGHGTASATASVQPQGDPYANFAMGAVDANAMVTDVLSNEEMAMWASAPMGLEVNDWNTYFNAFSDMHAEETGRGGQ